MKKIVIIMLGIITFAHTHLGAAVINIQNIQDATNQLTLMEQSLSSKRPDLVSVRTQIWNDNFNQVMNFVKRNSKDLLGRPDTTLTSATTLLTEAKNAIYTLYQLLTDQDKREEITENTKLKKNFFLTLNEISSILGKVEKNISINYTLSSKRQAQFVIKKTIEILNNILLNHIAKKVAKSSYTIIG